MVYSPNIQSIYSVGIRLKYDSNWLKLQRYSLVQCGNILLVPMWPERVHWCSLLKGRIYSQTVIRKLAGFSWLWKRIVLTTKVEIARAADKEAQGQEGTHLILKSKPSGQQSEASPMWWPGIKTKPFVQCFLYFLLDSYKWTGLKCLSDLAKMTNDNSCILINTLWCARHFATCFTCIACLTWQGGPDCSRVARQGSGRVRPEDSVCAVQRWKFPSHSVNKASLETSSSTSKSTALFVDNQVFNIWVCSVF